MIASLMAWERLVERLLRKIDDGEQRFEHAWIRLGQLISLDVPDVVFDP
jgi:hypothetical protein